MNRKLKNTIMVILCIVACTMFIVYAAFNTFLDISGTANIESNWNIEFTQIEEIDKTDGIVVQNTPVVSGTLVTFTVGLNKPGDYIEYRITVQNTGSLNAIIENIDAKVNGTDALKYEIKNIKIGDKLSKESSTNFVIRLSYDNSVVNQPNDTTSTITINIDYVQDIGQVITPEDPEIETPVKIMDMIIQNNEINTDESIDFSQISSSTNGNGLYYTTVDTSNMNVDKKINSLYLMTNIFKIDSARIYYYRGNVENNYIYFAGFYWRIIRSNEDGSIRIIYQGETANASQNNAQIANSKFNEGYLDNAYVGYMYGIPGSDNYEDTHTNLNDSTIKTILDSWYENNLLEYSNYIEDAGFCNDRSIINGTGYSTTYTEYASYDRVLNKKQPSFSCTNKNDLFTVSNTKGNGNLDYPIGLITADEMIYAGGARMVNNNEYYLYTGNRYWTMTPFYFLNASSGAYNWGIYSLGDSRYGTVNNSFGVRPVINLKSTVVISQGDGTANNPYIVNPN